MTKHIIRPEDSMGAGLIAVGNVHEAKIAPSFRFHTQAVGPCDADRAAYVALRDRIDAIKRSRIMSFLRRNNLRAMVLDLEAIPLELKWADEFSNTVVTVGKNNLLDVYFRNQTQTATWYVGLISSVSWSAINAADTMSSHAGWTEAATNQPTYSQGTRPALTVGSAASGGSLASSAASAFSITGTGTAKGAFITSDNTKAGTTGTLYSAGLFTGGDRAVINGDTINVSTTLSA